MVIEMKKIYKQKPNIKVDEVVKKRLDSIGKRNETYQDIIIRLLDQNDRLKDTVI